MKPIWHGSDEGSGPPATVTSPEPVPVPPDKPSTVPPTLQTAVPVRTHLRFSGVYLLTSALQGPTAVPGLRIDVDEERISLSKSDGSPVWTSEWDEVAELATPERSTLPDGSEGVVLAVTTAAGRVHRFVVPTANPASLESVIAVGRRQGVAPAGPEREASPLLAGVVVVATAAVVTVLLLGAGHVVHL